jgi:DNA-binding MarR family transcriptional regulator
MSRATAELDPSDALVTSGTANIVGYRLRRAQLSVFQRFLAVFDEMNLRPAEYSVLVLIGDNPGRKQTDIAEVLGIKRANFVALAHGLEARGLIERRAVSGDKRANALHLSEAGTAFLSRARAQHQEMEMALVDKLGGTAAREQLFALLARLS